MSLLNVFTIWLTPALQKYILYLLGISLACSENIAYLACICPDVLFINNALSRLAQLASTALSVGINIIDDLHIL